MNIKRITAIVPIGTLSTLEKNLRACGVPGVTVEHVQGYGEHPNFFRRDLMKDNARVVLYTEAHRVDEIVAAIAHCAQDCGYSGILAVEGIDRLVKLPDGADVVANTLSDHGERP
jgi:nitrogen regulatory protein P-II 1